MIRPQQANVMSTGDMFSFTHVKGPVERWIVTGTTQSNGELRLGVAGPQPTQHFDYVLHLAGPDLAELSFADPPPGIHFPAMQLFRAAASDTVAPLWAADKSYTIDRDYPTSMEMTAIFEADQADRHGPSIDWSQVGPRDEARRTQTRALLEKGALNSGLDFERAAFIFQHGSKPGDYLLAHTLASIAVARNRPTALWIAAATLDRYLQQIGQPQIYGTQFAIPSGGSATQEPYDHVLIPDSLRKALAIPTLAEQNAQRQSYDSQAQAATSARK